MIWCPENLENDLLKLKLIADEDFEKLYEVASDPLIWEQHPDSDRYQRPVFKKFFDSAIEEKSAFIIIDKSSGKFIGCTRYYDYKPENSSIAIGYTFLARKYWGGVFNLEVKKLLVNYAFQHVSKIYFHIGKTNLRSKLGTEKLGAIQVNEVLDYSETPPEKSFEYLLEIENWKYK